MIKNKMSKKIAGVRVQTLSVNDKGFAISALLYPAFIIIITITVLVLITLIQSSFSMTKLTTELQGDMTDNNTMKSLKENAEEVLNDSKNKITWSGDSESKINLYNVTQGKIELVSQNGELKDSNLTAQVNTTNWKGRFFTEEDGTQFLFINNGKYCAYKTAEMSGIAVYNSGTDTENECIEKLKAQTNCSEVIDMVTEGNTVQKLQDTVSYLQQEIDDLKGQNTTIQDFLKSHPVGSIYVSTDSTNPGNTYTGSTWVAYAQGRTIIGAGSTTDARGTTASFSGGQAGGEYNQALDANNLPSHTHSVSTTGSISNGSFSGSISSASCYATGTTDGGGAHNHNTYVPNSSTGGNYYGFWADFTTGSASGGQSNVTSWVNDHTHTFHTSGCSVWGSVSGGSGSVSGTVNASGSTSSVGSNTAFNIQNPYIVVYMWQRTA